jgi:hypothetical protein
VKQGLKLFGQKGVDAIFKKVQQTAWSRCTEPMEPSKLN